MRDHVSPTVAVVTITHGRDAHLLRQWEGLGESPPDLYVVVAMGEPPPDPVARSPAVVGLQLPVASCGLPLAAARNAGAHAALDAGADILIFLDVDCIPGPDLVARYAAAVTVTAEPALLCGPVAYLPPPPAGGYPYGRLDRLAEPHPARPVPPAGTVMADDRFELFWSLSFALGAATWHRLGGFHEGYAGYGAEDTDYALSAAAAGARLYWVGGALAYHQHHKPARHEPDRIAEMVRNARLFRSRHGFWPMRTWLDELAADGVVEFAGGDLLVGPLTTEPGRTPR
jgi:hypothetical protein